VAHARKLTTELNQLSEHIEVQHVADQNTIFSELLQDRTDRKYAFSMCNPPFFDTEANAEQAQQSRKRANAATQSELMCRGGEVAFVQSMVTESRAVQTQVTWFTTMLGLHRSVEAVRRVLFSGGGSTGESQTKQHLDRAPLVVETKFQQGKQTRYGMAWTYDKDAYQRYLQYRRMQSIRSPLNVRFVSSAAPMVRLRSVVAGMSPVVTLDSTNSIPIRGQCEAQEFKFTLTLMKDPSHKYGYFLDIKHICVDRSSAPTDGARALFFFKQFAFNLQNALLDGDTQTAS
jgi:hypothetical protein